MAGIKILSRKTLMTVLAVVGAAFAFFSKEFGLEIDTVGFMAMVSAVLLWVGFEARLDIKRIIERVGPQIGKFKDPKFWIAFVTAVITAANEIFEMNLPIELIIGVLAVIMSFLFKKEGDAVANGV